MVVSSYFLFVNIVALKLRKEAKVNPVVSGTGTGLSLVALVILIYRMVVINPLKLTVLASVIISSFVIEDVYRRVTGRELSEYIDERLRLREHNIKKTIHKESGVNEYLR